MRDLCLILLRQRRRRSLPIIRIQSIHLIVSPPPPRILSLRSLPIKLINRFLHISFLADLVRRMLLSLQMFHVALVSRIPVKQGRLHVVALLLLRSELVGLTPRGENVGQEVVLFDYVDFLFGRVV